MSGDPRSESNASRILDMSATRCGAFDESQLVTVMALHPLWQRLLSFVPAGIACGLGVWQFRRRFEKIKAIEVCNRQFALPPGDNTLLLQDLRQVELQAYRVLDLRGDWVHEETRLVGPRPCPRYVSEHSRSGANPFGYFVVTPLQVEGLGPVAAPVDDSGLAWWPVLVNRGWIPREQVADYWKNVRAFAENTTTPSGGQTELRAVPQQQEKSSFFMPRNRPQDHKWFRLDSKDLGGRLLLEELDEQSPVQSDATHPKDPLASLSVYRPTSHDLCQFYISPETHANYSITWFTLSAMLAFLGWYRNRRLPIL
ncbi:hypothetical protein F1559_001003 [Cyanidiococcus yangmingshanensis]|uniref:SURF1-like protein n=1 Tax=Cyanidiococcus yangmingshanensis TaxID=2690220 RepID=A0A7J7IEB3_9RHOD|nr:hypothetical protein F1559_001003 [Cyanidiococcus yangmingshanensis]